MIVKDSERGYVLLMVLLTIIVFTVLGLGLFSMNISAAKQFNNKEQNVQSRHLAEMGVLHFKSLVEIEVAKNQVEISEIKEIHNSDPNPEESLETKIAKQNEIFCNNLNDIKIPYKLEVKYGVSPIPIPCPLSEETKLTIISLGKINGDDRNDA